MTSFWHKRRRGGSAHHHERKIAPRTVQMAIGASGRSRGATLPIRLLPTPTKCGVRPFPGVKPVEGWRDRASRYSEQRAERVEGIEAPIESKGELVEVGL